MSSGERRLPAAGNLPLSCGQDGMLCQITETNHNGQYLLFEMCILFFSNEMYLLIWLGINISNIYIILNSSFKWESNLHLHSRRPITFVIVYGSFLNICLSDSSNTPLPMSYYRHTPANVLLSPTPLPMSYYPPYSMSRGTLKSADMGISVSSCDGWQPLEHMGCGRAIPSSGYYS